MKYLLAVNKDLFKMKYLLNKYMFTFDTYFVNKYLFKQIFNKIQ